MMDFSLTFFGKVFTEAVGWFLVHSVWQGGVIAILLLLALNLLKGRSAQLRYYISYGALVLLLLASSVTFHKALIYSQEKAELKESIIRNPSYLIEQIKETKQAFELTPSPVSTNQIRLKRVKLRSALQVYFPWIVSVWVAGLIFYFLRVSGSILYLVRIRNAPRLLIDPEWRMKTTEFSYMLKIKRKIGIFLSENINMPITIGYLKPLVLLPASLLAGPPPEMIEAIIAHELAHIKRNDYLLNIFQTLIETLFFYHPGVWYISSRIRRERELACDDIAIGLTTDRVNYAKALAFAQQTIFETGSLSLAFAPRKNSLLERIKRLNTKITMKTNLFEKLTAGFIILSAFLLLSFMIDGKNSEFKNSNSPNPEATEALPQPKSFPEPGVSPVPDTHRKIVRFKHRADMEEIDSLVTVLHTHGSTGEEVEKVIEIAMTDPEIIDIEEIMQSVQIALSEIDMEELSKELELASKELELASKEMEFASQEMEKAMRTAIIECEELSGLESLDSLDHMIQTSVHIALESACKELENLNIDSIVTQAMAEASETIADLDIDIIISDALADVSEALEEEHVEIIKIRKELIEEKMTQEERKQYLEERETELQIQLEDLEEQLKKVKKQQKEVSAE